MVWRRWLLIAICVCVGLAGAYGVVSSQSKAYRGSVTVLIQVNGASNTQDAYAGGQLAIQLAQTYAYVADSPSVARSVQEQLGLASPPGLHAAAIAQTPLITITDSYPDPSTAKAAVGAAVKGFAQSLSTYIGSSRALSVLVVDPPSATPTSFSKTTGLAYGGLIGLLVGLAAAWVLEQLDRSFRQAGDLAGVPVDPILATVPRLRSVSRQSPNIDPSADPAGADAYEALRTALRFLNVGKPIRSVLVTSPDGPAGKTTTVVNLAEVLARAGETVVAVDADLRSSGLTSALGLEGEVGLSSVLVGDAMLSDALLWRDRLGVLTTGAKPPNPSELLGSDAMAKLISTLAGRADRVLIDGTSMPRFSDSLALAPMVDAVLLVLRPGQSRRADIAEACRRLEVIGVRVVGSVLNAASGANLGTASPTSRSRSGWASEATGLPSSLPEGALRAPARL